MDLEAQALAALDVAETKDANNDAPAEAPENTGEVVEPKEEQKEEVDAPVEEKEQDGQEASEDKKEEEAPEDKPEDEVVEEAPAEIKPAFDPESSLESFVYEGLPDITVVGKDGKEYTVKVPEELPDDFEFRTVKEEKLFDQAMIKQSGLAENLVGDYNQQQQVATQQTYNNNLKSEIDAAIADGRIPKFDGKKLNMEGKGEQRAQQVLDYMNELNEGLAKAGKGYRVQSFEQALTLLEANEAKAKLAEYQKSIDNGKKNVASMAPSTGQSGNGETTAAKAMPRNMSATDFVSMLDAQGEL